MMCILYTAMVSSSIYLLVVRYCSVVPIGFSNCNGATDVVSLDVGQDDNFRFTLQLFDRILITSS